MLHQPLAQFEELIPAPAEDIPGPELELEASAADPVPWFIIRFIAGAALALVVAVAAVSFGAGAFTATGTGAAAFAASLGAARLVNWLRSPPEECAEPGSAKRGGPYDDILLLVWL